MAQLRVRMLQLEIPYAPTKARHSQINGYTHTHTHTHIFLKRHLRQLHTLSTWEQWRGENPPGDESVMDNAIDLHIPVLAQ